MNRRQTTTNLNPADQLSLVSSIDLVNLLWRRRRILLGSLAVTTLLGLLYYFLVPPEYLAQADVLLVQKNPGIVTGDQQYVTSFSDYVATHRALIISPMIVKSAVEMSNLHSLPTFQEYPADWDLSGIIIEDLTVSGGPRDLGDNADSIMRLAYQGPVERDCPAVVNAVLDSYMKFLDRIYKDMSDNTMQLVEEAREVLQNDLKQQEEEYIQFREDSPLVTRGTDEVNPLQTRLEAIETERTNLLIRRAEIEGQLSAIRKASDAEASGEQLLALVTRLRGRQTSTDTTTANVSASLDTQILQLADREKELLEHYGPNHPKVVTIRERINAARRLLALPSTAYVQNADAASDDAEPTDVDAVNLYSRSLEQELETIKSSEQLLTELYRIEHDAAKELSGFQLKDEGYRRNMDRTQQLYDGIVNRLQEVSLVKNYGGFEAQVIAEPVWAERVVPSLLITVAGVLLSGCMLGFALAMIAEMKDKSFRHGDEIQARLRVPLLGEIPNSPAAPDDVRRTLDPSLRMDPKLYALFQPRSQPSEAIRSLRTTLMINRRSSDCHMIQVTSPSPADGKSTLTANLAVSLAQLGHRVLVIDANLDGPRQHEIFGVDGTEGISSLVAADLPLQQVVKKTSIEGLWLLASGVMSPEVVEIFSSKHFTRLLQAVRSEYDYVLIDSEALLTNSDPCVIAAQTDGLLLVLRPNRDSRARATRAMQLLNAVGMTPMGVVVNRIGGPGARRYRGGMPDHRLAISSAGAGGAGSQGASGRTP